MGNALDMVNRFYSLFASGELDASDDLFAEDCAFVTPPGSMAKPEHRMLAEGFKNAFPDANMVIEHTLEGNGEVYVEGRFRGTHTGDLVSPQGTMPPSGKKIDVRFAEFYEMRDGLITTQRTYWDQVEMMTQLGAMPG